MRIAVPNKGRIHDPTISLLERAGLHVENGADRKLYAETVDPDVSVLFARAADVPEYVWDGAAAVGITGLDQVRESGHDLVELLDLEFGRCRLVLAAPEDGDITEPGDLAGRTVATEFPRITREYFSELGIDPEVVEVTGATELTPHVDMADAIIDITSTGTTLRVNRLAVIDTVLESSVHLFAREDAAVDAPGHRDRGVFDLYPEYREWGVIAAWAWTYRVLLDVLVESAYVDPRKVVTTGHSRGGKTALCAAIYDDRVAVAAPNSSGSGGTGSWRFFDGEHDEQTVAYHEDHHAHWWSPRFVEFVGHEDRLPFDAHTLRAAVAPRAVLNTHARHDWWANPYGTALATHAAQPVFDWLGVSGHNAQHWRDGDHDQRAADWAALFDFCDGYFFDRPTDREFAVNPHPDSYAFDRSRFRYAGAE